MCFWPRLNVHIFFVGSASDILEMSFQKHFCEYTTRSFLLLARFCTTKMVMALSGVQFDL